MHQRRYLDDGIIEAVDLSPAQQELDALLGADNACRSLDRRQVVRLVDVLYEERVEVVVVALRRPDDDGGEEHQQHDHSFYGNAAETEDFFQEKKSKSIMDKKVNGS